LAKKNSSLADIVEERAQVRRVRITVTVGNDVVPALDRAAMTLPAGVRRDRVRSALVDAYLAHELGLAKL